jgi:Fur family ferric uptake transcriptional regulator
VCRSCGGTIEVEGSATERWSDAVAAEHGLTTQDLQLEVFRHWREGTGSV